MNFPVAVRGHDIDLTTRERAIATRRIAYKLEKFSRRVLRVSIRFEDINGPKGGQDTVCRIKVVLRGLPTVIAEQTAGDLLSALDLASERAEHAVHHAVDRARG
jgi:ribosome-associated translation inhibitor RaiA